MQKAVWQEAVRQDVQYMQCTTQLLMVLPHLADALVQSCLMIAMDTGVHWKASMMIMAVATSAKKPVSFTPRPLVGL